MKLLSVFLLLYFFVSPVSSQNDILSGTTWVRTITTSICFEHDTLWFESDSTASWWFGCDVGWDFYADYSRIGDTITVLIIDAQLEVDNTEGLEPTSKYVLIVNDTSSEIVEVKNQGSLEWEDAMKTEYGIFKRID